MQTETERLIIINSPITRATCSQKQKDYYY